MTLIIIHTAKRPRFKSGLVVVFKYYFNCFATPPPALALALARRKPGWKRLEQSGEEAKAHWVIKSKKTSQAVPHTHFCIISRGRRNGKAETPRLPCIPCSSWTKGAGLPKTPDPCRCIWLQGGKDKSALITHIERSARNRVVIF